MTTRDVDSGGPYLSAAFFCEKVLVEQDGVKSAIRIVDRVTHTVAGPAPPAEMEPFNYNIFLFLRFKSGRARGTKRLEIHPIKPSGESLPPSRRTILFEGEDDRGVDSIGRIMLQIDQVGIYWFDIILDGFSITRVPFRVIYMPQVMTMPPQTGAPPPQ